MGESRYAQDVEHPQFPVPVGWAEVQLHKIAMYECQAIGPLDFSRAMQATVRWFIRGYAERMWSDGVPFELKKPGSPVHLRLETRVRRGSPSQG